MSEVTVMPIWAIPLGIVMNDDKVLHDSVKREFKATPEFIEYVIAKATEFSKKFVANPKVEIVKHWSVDLQRFDENAPHNHPDCDLVACYYVEIDPGASPLRLFDPRPHSIFTRRLTVKSDGTVTTGHTNMDIPPQEGMMVLFPSHMMHAVPAQIGEGRRRCIAINMKVTDS